MRKVMSEIVLYDGVLVTGGALKFLRSLYDISHKKAKDIYECSTSTLYKIETEDEGAKLSNYKVKEFLEYLKEEKGATDEVIKKGFETYNICNEKEIKETYGPNIFSKAEEVYKKSMFRKTVQRICTVKE